MNFLELELSARITVDDNSPGDRLWSQAEWLEYANDAENEACERANLLIDSTNSLTNIAVVTSTAILTISELIIEIQRAHLLLGTEPLLETTEKVLDLTILSWRSVTGTPRSFVRDETNKIRLFPYPIVADTLDLKVSRFPLTAMTTGDSPEIDARYHAGLLDWMIHRAYSKNDSETLNIGKAKDYAQRFEKRFGPKRILPD